ncbi:MAG TPA: hypothetical protein DEH78_22090 [Solibacterales bacterium]|nr:hypothetical protein [Bryobacterales bacterium]
MKRAALLLLVLPAALAAYPLDGAERTGIRRLTGYKLFLKLPPGAGLTTSEIKLRLRGQAFDIDAGTAKDAALQSGLERIFAARNPSYSVALLDISDPAKPRYAALRETDKRIPGSVGKLLVATGLFDALRRRFPEDTAARERFLRETVLTADRFVYTDGKTVPTYEVGAARVVNKRVEAGDRYNLYEWLDHMLSQSSNAAGSFVWKEAMLMRAGAGAGFLEKTPKTELSRLALETLEDPLRAAGLDTSALRLGTFFTRNASAAIPGTASYANPRELLRWLVRLEQGRLIDEWSSLELKRLLYFARPRYRYASSPALNRAAVYFKSGSLFECAPEPGFQCGQYKGNKTNLMHSVAIVESGTKVYLVALMSNVLKLNSAVEHQTIATEIEKLVQAGR